VKAFHDLSIGDLKFGAKKSGSTVKPVYGGHTGHAPHIIRIMGMPHIVFIMGIPATPWLAECWLRWCGSWRFSRLKIGAPPS
jgi:hypothetical protein